MVLFSDDASSSTASLPSAPLLAASPHPLSSQTKTFANVFIAIVGAGVLGLPYTFRRTGWLSGSIMLFCISSLTFHCMLLLVRTRRRLDSKITSFGDLGFAVCGPLGRLAVDCMIVLSQAGFCIGYLIFISNTLAHLSDHIPKPLSITAMLPFQLGLNSIKSLTHLAPLSIFADIVDMAAMGVVVGEDITIYMTNPPPTEAFGSASTLLYGLGVAVYAFEGIGMVLPLEAEAAEKDGFGRTLGLSMGIITVMYAIFGVMGYLAFGSETRDIITTNFGGGVVTLLVQIGLCVNLFFTFPIMMHPVYEVAERWLCGKEYCIWLRWAAVMVVSLVAVMIPNFTDFLSLVGSSVCCILGFVLPALFHLKVFGNEMGWMGMLSDVAIVVIGIVFAVSGTYSSLMEIFFSVKA